MFWKACQKNWKNQTNVSKLLIAQNAMEGIQPVGRGACRMTYFISQPTVYNLSLCFLKFISKALFSSWNLWDVDKTSKCINKRCYWEKQAIVSTKHGRFCLHECWLYREFLVVKFTPCAPCRPLSLVAIAYVCVILWCALFKRTFKISTHLGYFFLTCLTN